MSFNSFNLFTGLKGYVNQESLRGATAVNSLGSGLGFAADQFLGIAQNSQGQGILNGLLRQATGNLGYLVDTVTGQRLVLQYTSDITESGGAEYEMQGCIGRSNPRPVYKYGKERILEMPITLTMREYTRDDVKRAMRFLQSLAYPDYTGDEASLTPHPVVVVQGQLYQDDLWIVKDYRIQWGTARDPRTQLPSEATCNLTLAEIPTTAKSSGDILRL